MLGHSRLAAQDTSGRAPVLSKDTLIDAYPDRAEAADAALRLGRVLIAHDLGAHYGMYTAPLSRGWWGVHCAPLRGQQQRTAHGEASSMPSNQ